MRIDHYIASQSMHSRRDILKFIDTGQISVNRVPISSMAFEMDPDRDVVYIKDTLIPNKYGLIYYLYHKPKGVITTLSDPQNRRSLSDELRRLKLPPVVFPVGRLDRDTSGLLLLTNDGDVAHQILHPSFEFPKTYYAQLHRPLDPRDLVKLKKGVFLEDGPARFDKISGTKKQVWVTLSEGRNRIVRRLFSALGYDVLLLHRVSIGKLELGDLPSGSVRSLSRKHIQKSLLF